MANNVPSWAIPVKKQDVPEWAIPVKPETIESEPMTPEMIESNKLAEFEREQLASGNIKPAQPTFGQRFKEDIGQMVGGGVGGWAGGVTGAKIASKMPSATPLQKGLLTLAGGVGGAFLGGMGGKGYQQMYQMSTGGKPKTLKELYTDQLISGLEEGASELGGRGIAKGLSMGANKILAPAFKKMATKGAENAAELLAKQGGHLTLAQATKVRLFDTMEAIAEGSLFGGGKLQKIHMQTQPKNIVDATQSLMDDFASGIGGRMTPAEVGDVTLAAINNSEDVFKSASKAMYAQVDNAVKQAGLDVDIIPTTEIKKFAAQRLADVTDINKSAMGTTLLESISNLPDNLTFQQATSLKTALLTHERSMGVNKDVALGIVKQLTKLTDDTIENTTKILDPQVYDMWRTANEFHKLGKAEFNAKIIKVLQKTLKENPERAVPLIFKDGAVDQIVRVKKNVDSTTWDALKYGYLQKVIKSSTPDNIISGTTFLDTFNKLGEDALTETFNPKELNAIRKFGEGVKLLQRPTQEYAGTGKLVIAIAQAGLITGSTITNRPKEAFAIAFTPYALSKIVANPIWNDLLMQTVKSPVNRATNITRLVRVASGLDLQRINENRLQSGDIPRTGGTKF